jgi:hypothetical protein
MPSPLKPLIVISAVVAAVVALHGEKHAPGIFVDTIGNEGGPTRLVGRVFIQDTGSYKKAIFTGGFKSIPIMGTLPTAKAVSRIKAGSPTFNFYLDLELKSQSNPPSLDSFAGLGGGDGMPQSARSAEEFHLLRMRVKDDKREAQIGATKSQGFESKDTVAFTTKAMGTGAFIVTPKEPLAPGEYGFYFAGMGGAGGQLWDFGVD